MPRPRASGWPARSRRAGNLPPPVAAVSGLPRRGADNAACASGAGRSHRCRDRSRPPGLAPRLRNVARRGRRRRAGALGRAGPARGGLAAAAAFLERAAALRPAAARRALYAARPSTGRSTPGGPDAARRGRRRRWATSTGPCSSAARADRPGYQARRGRGPLLIDAARQLEPLDPALARETLEALRAGSIGRPAAVRGRREAAYRAPRRGGPACDRPAARGSGPAFHRRYAASARRLSSLGAVRDRRRPGLDVRWPWTARRVAPELLTTMLACAGHP